MLMKKKDNRAWNEQNKIEKKSKNLKLSFILIRHGNTNS